MIRSILCLIANPTAPTTKYFRPSTVPCHRQISRMDREPEPDSRSGLNNRYTATINTNKIEKLVNTAPSFYSDMLEFAQPTKQERTYGWHPYWSLELAGGLVSQRRSFLDARVIRYTPQCAIRIVHRNYTRLPSEKVCRSRYPRWTWIRTFRSA